MADPITHENMTPLQQAARCAMAELSGTDFACKSGDETIRDLYVALKNENVDVSDYDIDYAQAIERLVQPDAYY